MLQKAEAHLRAGNRAAAHECFQKAVDITPAIAKDFIEVCGSDVSRISYLLRIT